MIIEVGKYYKTRNGEKALINNSNMSSHWPFYGLVFGSGSKLPDCSDKYCSWNRDGKRYDLIEDQYDLISEWSDK